MSRTVVVDVQEGVGVITIDRPDVRNAIDLPTAQQIAAALDEVDERADILAAVLTGAGPVFSAGMDLKAFSATGERPLVDGRGAFGICERATEKPIIAAVEGKALGGGTEIALACDFIVAAEDSQFGLPEVRRGLVAAAGGVLRLPRRIPHAVALEMIMTGEPIDAARAHSLGLVNHVVKPGAACDRAVALARLIAANAPMAVKTAKFLVNSAVDWPATEMFGLQRSHVDPVRSSNDAAEGARAFVEKRSPVWTNS